MSDGFQMPEILRNGRRPPPEAPAPGGHSRRFWSLLPWMLTASLLTVAAVTWFIFREPMHELTPESLAAARERWQAAEISSYDLELDIVTPGSLEAVRFVVRVRDDRVVEWLRDGEPTTGDAQSYTINGLFGVLDRELEMSQEAVGPLAPASGGAFLRVRFDNATGIPMRFLRVIRGSNRSSEFRITLFQRLEANRI